MRQCFVCKDFKEVKPIGMKEIKCKEVFLCEECNEEVKKISSKNKLSKFYNDKYRSLKIVK